MEACVTSYRCPFCPPVLCFTKMFSLTTGPYVLFFPSFFKLSSLFLQFLRALGISFPVFALHPVKRLWRASLFVWNHYSEGSWHVQVDYLREARHQVSVSGCQISGLLSPSRALCVSMCGPGSVSSGHSVSAASHYPLAGSVRWRAPA